MFGHVRFQDGNMYTEQSKKLTLNGISNTHTPYKGIWQQSGASFAMKNARCPTRAPFLMPIFIQRAQHQHIHTLCMDSLYACVYLPPFGVAAIGCHYGAGRTVF